MATRHTSPGPGELLNQHDQRAVKRALLRMHLQSWGIAFGGVAGAGLFVATIVLVVRGGEDVGAHLRLLSVYFPGYAVSLRGAFIGFVYAFVGGYAVGRTIGAIYNKVLDAS